MTRKVFNKIMRGVEEAHRVAQGDPAAVMGCRVTPTCGCVFCDLNLNLYRDSNGFYHDGPEDMRITCSVSHDDYDDGRFELGCT